MTSDDPIPTADAGSNSPAVLILPDNTRDPGLTQVLREAQEQYFAGKRREALAPITRA